MEAETFKQYVAGRYMDQISWYTDRASFNKLLYQVFQWGVIFLSATVPVLVASVPRDYQWITIIVSIALAIGTAAVKTFKFQENWINYRAVSETLKKEKHFYDANLDAYSTASDRDSIFVERVESLISRENSLWMTTHREKAPEEKKR